jgi:hypothetical protein
MSTHADTENADLVIPTPFVGLVPQERFYGSRGCRMPEPADQKAAGGRFTQNLGEAGVQSFANI